MEREKGRKEEEPSWNFKERLREYPEMRRRFEELLRVVENAEGDAVKANEAEERVVEELRQMGQTALQAWADRKHARVTTECNKRGDLTSNGKKNCIGRAGTGRLS